jgi:signal transduction histidine kinase
MRRRTLVSIVGVVLVALALFGIPLALTIRNLTIDDELNELERSATRAATTVSSSTLRRGDRIAVPHAQPPIHLGVYDAEGNRVAGSGPVNLEPGLKLALQGDVRTSRRASLIAAAPVVTNEHIIGVVRAASPAGEVRARVLRSWAFVGLLALLAVAISVALARWQARRITKPLTALTANAHRLGDGDFTVRNEPSGVAEIDEVGRALDASARRIDEALARERAFSADASHQLRTPLTGLRLTLERALLAGDAGAATLEDALDEVDRLEQTVTDLLDLARDTHGERTPIEVQDILEDVGTRWQSALQADGRQLELVATDPLPAYTAPAAIRQILDVLVDNAREHGSGTVTVRARAAADGLAIDVSDEGAGITGDGEQVFRRRDGSREGRGIGLALARALAEAEGGRLLLTHARPRPVFTLVLPRGPAPLPS